MANKTNIFKFIDSTVAAGTTDLDLSAIILAGRVVILKTFGGGVPFDGNGSFIAVQWGSAASWSTIRVITHEAEFQLMREFVGDGSKRFRIARVNKHSADQQLFAWIEGFIHDA